MERLNSMSKAEILAIHGISTKSYRYVQEGLDDFRAAVGDNTWSMPDFDDTEMGFIMDELHKRRPEDFYYLVSRFCDLAQDSYQHPQMEVMERIYYKLSSIHADEFQAIMTGKGVAAGVLWQE